MNSRAPRVPTWPLLVSVVVATAVACGGGGSGPELASVDRQVAQVGVQLSLTLEATDPDGDDLAFRFRSDIPDIENRATLTRSPSGAAIWRWTPLAADVREWLVDFEVSDGERTDTITVTIDVQSAVGGSGAPVFRRPLGTGTTLDLEDATCVAVEIQIEDQDSTSVVLTEEEPRIEGGTLESTGGLGGRWRWCPTREQAAAEDRYTLTLAADDLTHPRTLKTYLIVLRDGDGSDCPGAAPEIDHTPADEASLGNLTIAARVTDDRGLKRAPLFYYSETDPGDEPDLAAMTQVEMVQIDGDLQDGTWAADVENPVADLGAGASRELFYVIVADDDDDTTGSCDHVTASKLFSMTVTNPGGTGAAGLCEPCSADVQCGAGDLCVRVGVTNDAFCLEGCTGAADCPTGYSCSTQPVTSVGGASARQCVPDAGSCTASTSCEDDVFEQNDSRAQADAQGPLPPNDVFDLTSCPLVTGGGDDTDFFVLDIAADSRVTLELDGGAATDLDLAIVDGGGATLQESTSLASQETVSRCLTPGRYYARIDAFGVPARNDYVLAYERAPQDCATVCNDDADEDDDSAAQARIAQFPLHIDSGTICTDDDWYAVELLVGDRLIVDLEFTQSDATGDLDLHLIDPSGEDLTPCVEPFGSTCTSAQGQSADSNEHFEFEVTAAGDYHVVVHGWDGSTNPYGIQIEVREP